MQKLQFESSWDKTLSTKDRERINKAFSETSLSTDDGIQFIPLWEAINHKGELLVTVLIHNFGKQSLAFYNKSLRYWENKEIAAEYTFTLPSLFVERETSMPWTFIFPSQSILHHPKLENGRLEVVE